MADGGWGWGDWWPWFDLAWWPGYCNNYCYGVPYAGDVYLAYADAATPYAAYQTGGRRDDVAADGLLTPAEQSMGPLVPGPSTSSVDGAATGDDPFDFHGRARAAFAQGDYRNATYLAAHAAVDEPRNPKTHLLYSLGMFALGEYRGAAMESHAVVSLGKTPDWPTLYGFYGNVEPYTAQLRTLEKYVHANPSSPEGRFLLGFHYLMAGHANEAKDELLSAETGAAGPAGGPIAQGSRGHGAARDRQAVVGVAARRDAQAGIARAAGSATSAGEIAASGNVPRMAFRDEEDGFVVGNEAIHRGTKVQGQRKVVLRLP